jgi:hypothetical protein
MMFDHLVGIGWIGRVILEATRLPDGRLLAFVRGLSLIGSLVIRPLDGRSLWRCHGVLLSVHRMRHRIHWDCRREAAALAMQRRRRLT